MATLTLGKQTKNGGARYQVDGLRGSIFFPPSMLAEGAQLPQQLTLDGITFADPSAQRSNGGTRRDLPAPIKQAREEARQLREQAKQRMKDAREQLRQEREARKAERAAASA